MSRLRVFFFFFFLHFSYVSHCVHIFECLWYYRSLLVPTFFDGGVGNGGSIMMGAHWNTQNTSKYITIVYCECILRIPMGSHHNTATIRGRGGFFRGKVLCLSEDLVIISQIPFVSPPSVSYFHVPFCDCFPVCVVQVCTKGRAHTTFPSIFRSACVPRGVCTINGGG